jgi:hypothetical protein
MDEAEVIYLEVDAEITEAIDKLKHAKSDAVKLVVPARSSLLQSAVNLKLLKKAAKDHGKEMAIVTNDKTAKYLAGGVGLAVASSLKAEPKIPEGIKEELSPDIVEPDPDEALYAGSESSGKGKESPRKDTKSSAKEREAKSKPTEGAEAAAISKRAIGEGHNVEDLAVSEELAGKKAKAKVPNYSAFQKKLLVGTGILGAIVLGVILLLTLPTAKLTVIAKADTLAINSPFVIDAAISESDAGSLTYAGQRLTLQKDLTQNYSATGKKDVGSKATGSVAIKNCEDSNPRSLPAGSTVSAQGKNFTTNSALAIPAGSFSGGGKNCTTAAVSVGITAAANGDAYNLGTTSFSVPLSGSFTTTGSTAGGTSKTVTVVTQADIDSAKQQALEAAANQSKDSLLAKADKKDVVFSDTFTTNVDSVSPSAPVDAEASNGTVTVKVTYAIFTTTKDAMNSLLDTLAKDAMPKGEQQLYQNGLGDAQFSLVKAVSDTRVQLSVATKAYYGQKINKQQIARDTSGKPKKNVTAIVQNQNPSVEKTLVEGRPSLLPNMPSLSSRINVEIRVSTD